MITNKKLAYLKSKAYHFMCKMDSLEVQLIKEFNKYGLTAGHCRMCSDVEMYMSDLNTVQDYLIKHVEGV